MAFRQQSFSPPQRCGWQPWQLIFRDSVGDTLQLVCHLGNNLMLVRILVRTPNAREHHAYKVSSTTAQHFSEHPQRVRVRAYTRGGFRCNNSHSGNGLRK